MNDFRKDEISLVNSPTSALQQEEDTGNNDQEKQSIEAELCKLREALRDAEERMKTQEEERQQALQKLQTSTEVR